MHNVKAHAVRTGKTIEVTISGDLSDSCHTARISGFYPGTIVYIVDPGAAQVFIEETIKPGSGFCLTYLVPWVQTLSIADTEHSKVEIFVNNHEVIEVPVVERNAKFIVIAVTNTHNRCSIVPNDAVYPAIYSKVFGPASHEECMAWISANCDAGIARITQSQENKAISDCNLALNASVNRKQQPNALSVHGSVMVYTSETEVSITKATPQGINPAVLLLNLDVVAKPGPMKGTPRHFHYEETGDEVGQYTHVQVVSNKGDDCTVEIKVFG